MRVPNTHEVLEMIRENPGFCPDEYVDSLQWGSQSDFEERRRKELFRRGVRIKAAKLHKQGYVRMDVVDGRRRYTLRTTLCPLPKRGSKKKKREPFSIEIDGKRWALSEYCKRYGYDYRLIYGRLRRGWSPSKAIDTPKKGQ